MKYKHINIDSYYFRLLKRKGLVKTRCDVVCFCQAIQLFLMHLEAMQKSKKKKKEWKKEEQNKTGASRIIANPTTSSLGIPHLGKTTTET